MATRFAGSPQMASFMQQGFDAGLVGETGMQAKSQERQYAALAQGEIGAMGLDAMGRIKSAAHQARAIEAQADAQAAATRASGMSSMISSIAGGIGSLNFSGGGGASVSPSGSQSIGTGASNYSFSSYNTNFGPAGATSIGRFQ